MASLSNINASGPPFTSPNPIPPRRSSTISSRATSAGAAASATRPGSHQNHQSYQSFTHPAPLPNLFSPVVPAGSSAAAAAADDRHHHHYHHHHHQHQQQHQQQHRAQSVAVMQPHQHQHQPQQLLSSQPPDPRRFEHEDLNFNPERSWTEGKEKVIRAPFDYVASHPGKDFRTQLISAFNALLQVPPERLDIITRAVGMLHESSLLVDDVQDSSELRRGFPVAHNIFGVPQTINSANYIYFVALQELQRLNNPQIISVFADELVSLHRGQGMDLFWRDSLTCPTEDDYLEMVYNKTGGLFRLGIKLMQAESAAAVDCVPLVNLIGLIFQIRDDYMNLSSQEYSDNKGLCEDLTEGKFSFPVIHSIRANPGNMQLINILKQKTTDVQVKRYAVSYMESTGSFKYTEAVIAILIERARKVAREMDTGDGKADIMQKILDKMVIRNKTG